MLKKNGFCSAKRLTKPGEFRQVFAVKKKFSRYGFTLYYGPNKQSSSRLGLIVSKRCARLAVQRNRIKRVLREWFRQQQTIKIDNKQYVDLVVITHKKITRLKNQEINLCLEKLWRQLAL